MSESPSAIAVGEPIALDDEPVAEDVDPAAPSDGPGPEPTVATAEQRAPEPSSGAVEIRIARQTLIVNAAPDESSAIRGRIAMSEAFEVHAYVPGPACGGKGWGYVGNGGHVCLENTRKDDGKQPPRTLPELHDTDLPYFYVKTKDGVTARRWASYDELDAGAEPISTLEPEHDYAFTGRRRWHGDVVLVDEDRRVVLADEVERYRPPRFAGRNLIERPLPPDRVLAWQIAWPEAPVWDEPVVGSEPPRTLDYHEELLLSPTPVGRGRETMWEIEGGGFIEDKHVRLWRVEGPPGDVAEAEIWLDVDLDQQTLTLARGRTPLYATLISSGFKGPTPRGIFRITMKQAVGSMSSSPGSDDPYDLDAVPWIMYFSGNYALHGAYWHYRFGHKISHGCVNLAPKDARFVYEMTSPHPRAGWTHAYEAEDWRGTTVRIRRADAPVIDKRVAVAPVLPGVGARSVVPDAPRQVAQAPTPGP